MADFDERLQKLEEVIGDAQKELDTSAPVDTAVEKTTSVGGRCFSYVYIVGVLIPIAAAAALYFAKPKFVTVKEKGKQVVSWKSLGMWVGIITIIGWVGLYALNYCGVFGGAEACLKA